MYKAASDAKRGVITKQEFEKLTELASRTTTNWIFDYYTREIVSYFEQEGIIPAASSVICLPAGGR